MAVASITSEQARARVAAARAKVSKAKKGESFFEGIVNTLEGPLGPETKPEKELNYVGKVLGSPQQAFEAPYEAYKEVEGGVKTVVKGAEAAASASESVEGFLGKLSDINTWTRIGKILAGALLILFGLYLFAKAVSPAAVSTTVKVAKGIR